jgi:flagellar basal body-associated protein FliL
MAAKRRTWLWILLGVLGLCVVGVIAIAGFGMYFVRNHIHAGTATPTQAFKAFDAATARFKDVKPIYEVDEHQHPRQLRQFNDLATSVEKAEFVWVLAWDPDRQRLVKVSIPFWLLKLGRQKIDIMEGGFDFQRMQLDVNELQRVGPVLLFDYKSAVGQRVLIWTQ